MLIPVSDVMWAGLCVLYVSPERSHLPVRSHGVTTLKTSTDVVTAVRTLSLT
jgi:hypothetical protein